MASINIQISRDFKIILIACIYCIGSWIGYQLSFNPPMYIPIWPSAGIALAFLIIMGKESWPGISLGAIITQVFFFWGNDVLTPEYMILHTSLTVLGITFQAVAGSVLYEKFIGTRIKKPFARSKDAFRFLFIALGVSLIGTSFFTSSLYLTNLIGNPEVWKQWFSWGLGNAVSILLFTPLFLAWTKGTASTITREKLIEGLLFLVSIAGVLALYRVEFLSQTMESAFPFLVIPFLMWLSFRFKLNVALSVMAIVALYATFRTIGGNGPLYMDGVFQTTILLQTFVGVISISSLIISATVTERNIIQVKLEKFNENLESKVDVRTKALNEEIKTRTKAEGKLRVSNRNLRKTNAELDNFVYSVSHDLRSPIASVLGLINLAQKDVSKIMGRKYLQMIKGSVEQQDKFIKKILDQSRNARLEIKKEEIIFKDIIDETFNQLKYVNISEKITKKIHIKQDKPFYSDAWRLKVIFNNILSNSIRHKNGAPPNINIDVSIENGAAKIDVQDNGKGISRKHLRHVFKMFYRATDVNAGSGLGLYIVKETVEKLNGDIKLTSNEGVGTLVALVIPSLN